MRHLRIVGDGERDSVTLPPIAKTVLGADFTHTATPWPRLHRREKKAPGYSLKGYGLKLYYLLQGAPGRGEDGVIACIDADRERRRQRLKGLKDARNAHRSVAPAVPTALGEAKPHNEAWLLDDPVAVREALGLSSDHPIPAVTKRGSPKATLEELHQQSERGTERPVDVWPRIAERVDVGRCAQRKQTGFEAFVEEVRTEIGPLFANAG